MISAARNLRITREQETDLKQQMIDQKNQVSIFYPNETKRETKDALKWSIKSKLFLRYKSLYHKKNFHYSLFMLSKNTRGNNNNSKIHVPKE